VPETWQRTWVLYFQIKILANNCEKQIKEVSCNLKMLHPLNAITVSFLGQSDASMLTGLVAMMIMLEAEIMSEMCSILNHMTT
jgi:sulfur transfer protein SufE